MNQAALLAPRRVGVFRALQLGDMLCAIPALRALRAAWPAAQLFLIGLPWARSLAQRLPQVDVFIDFPGHAALPERRPDPSGWEVLRQQLLSADLDLLIQLHGDGSVVNGLLADLPVRERAGFCRAGEARALGPGFLCWPESGHEIERLLALVRHLGLPEAGRQLELPLRPSDRRQAQRLLAGAAGRGYACVHAGARLPSRRWPARRFAAVADHLAASGLQIVLTGGPEELELVAEVQHAMKQPALNLCGCTGLWSLAALVAGARLLVCNDTGLSHVAAALRCPSVVISCGSEVARWAPLDRRLHRVLACEPSCRPCMHAECPIGHGCALEIGVEEVLATVAALNLPASGMGLAVKRHADLAEASPDPSPPAALRLHRPA